MKEGETMQVIKKGWMIFSEYCKLRNILPNGYHLRRLENLPSEFKEDITPNSRTTWAVNINEADKIFVKEK